MDMKKVWTQTVYKALHRGWDSLSDQENKNLDIYYGWKIKTTLKGKKLQAIVTGYKEIFNDLRSEMVIFFLGKGQNFKNLEPDLLWKKFNNHSFNYLQYKYLHKIPRDSTFMVCDTCQRGRDYEPEEMQERQTALADIPAPINDLPDDLSEDYDDRVDEGHDITAEVMTYEYDDEGKPIIQTLKKVHLEKVKRTTTTDFQFQTKKTIDEYLVQPEIDEAQRIDDLVDEEKKSTKKKKKRGKMTEEERQKELIVENEWLNTRIKTLEEARIKLNSSVNMIVGGEKV